MAWKTGSSSIQTATCCVNLSLAIKVNSSFISTPFISTSQMKLIHQQRNSRSMQQTGSQRGQDQSLCVQQSKKGLAPQDTLLGQHSRQSIFSYSRNQNPRANGASKWQQSNSVDVSREKKQIWWLHHTLAAGNCFLDQDVHTFIRLVSSTWFWEDIN